MLEYFIEIQQASLAVALLLPLLGVAVSRAGAAGGVDAKAGSLAFEGSGGADLLADPIIDARLGAKAAFWRFLQGIGAGALVAVLLTALKMSTGWIVTEYWSMGLTAGVLLCTVAFLLLDLRLICRKDEVRARRLLLWSATLLAAFLVAYVLRGDLLVLREFVRADESLFDVAVVYRVLGWLGALVVVALCVAGASVAAKGAEDKSLRPLRALMLILYAIQGVLLIIQILYAHHMIPRVSWLRAILQVSINQGDFFLYALMALTLVLAGFALYGQRHKLAQAAANLAASNPALYRKAKAAWRHARRWSTVIVACFVVAALSLTAVRAYAEREIELTPAEPMNYVGSTVQIPLEAIEDGHLHRFAHMTPEDVEVRFIIIKKNATAWGVGLDACNICGAAGYYERDDEVVCKMCDVVMNKQTIGFPGGCNPVPLEFDVGDGLLTIETSLLDEEAWRFD
ncbi:MAG: Fe-S-containing protein [Coriobacteriales bacterium]|jgi:uncharacterized membrane protein|nr:Fe-S-containing protein [Coriobacteriales bacterium]